MRIKQIFACLLIVALFSACAKSDNSQSLTNSAPQTTETIKCLDYLYPLGYANDHGMYFIDFNSDGSNRINYIDFAKKSCVILCSRPECTHQDETCTAWLENCDNTPIAFSVDDKLLLAFNGAFLTSSYENYGKKSVASISIGNLDGSAMNKIAEFLPQEVFSGKYAISSENFYAITNKTEPKDDTVEHYSEISKVNIATGEVSKSKRQDLQSLQIEGAFENTLILTYLSANNNKTKNMLSTNVLLYDTVSEKETFICDINPDKASYKIAGNSLYTLDNATGELTVLDLQTNTQKNICNVYDGDIADEIYMKSIVTDGMIYEKRFMDKPSQTCFVEFASGEIFNINLPMQNNQSLDPNRFIEVVAEYNDQYLVISGLINDDVTFTSPQGESYSMPLARYEFAFISKENYKQSNGIYDFVA